jgi:epoxyqueuosine reductase
MNSDQLTKSVKELARHQGAALVGIASVDRFDPMPPYYDRAPRGHHPKEFLPTAKSVISIAQPVLNPVMDAPAILATKDLEMIPPDVRYPYMEMLYNHVGHVVQDYMLEFIAQVVGQYLMSHGYDAMIFPTTGLHPPVEGLTDKQIWEGHHPKWAEKYSPFRYTFGPFSHRHAATRAGLGEFGYNNIVLTKEFGARQRFNSIITDADLGADPLLTEQICLRDKCRLCLEACVVDAITLRDDEFVKDYRSVDQVDKNIIFIDTPAKTDPTLCRRRRERIPESPIRGDCARVCPLPAEPKNLPDRLRTMVDSWKLESGI